MRTRHTLLGLVLIAGGLLGSAATRAQQTTVMVDRGLGTPVRYIQTDPGEPDNVEVPILGGAPVTVSPNGTRVLLSDFGNGTQGPVGSGFLGGMTWMPTGQLGLSKTLLLTDKFAGKNKSGALFAMDLATRKRTVLSDFGNDAQGPLGVTPVAVTYANGLLGLGSTIYVIDNNAGTKYQGALFAVSPSTGVRTLLSDFGNSVQGPQGTNPIAIAIVPAGVLSVLGVHAGLVVLDNYAGTNGAGAVFTVDYLGNRRLLSDLGNSTQGPVAVSAKAITVVQTSLGLVTTIVVSDNMAGTNQQGALWAISPDGTRKLHSDFGSGELATQGFNPTGVVATADGTGNVLVTDDFGGHDPTQARVFLVTPNGQRTIYSDCTLANLGPCQVPATIIQWW